MLLIFKKQKTCPVFPSIYRLQHEWKFGRTRNVMGTRATSECFSEKTLWWKRETTCSLRSSKCKFSLLVTSLHQQLVLVLCFYLTIRSWARDFYCVIVDEGVARVNYPVIEISSSWSKCVSINLLVIQNFHLNSLHSHFESTKKRLPVHAATLLTIYHRIGHE